jgi:hypothetical protein
MNESTFKIDYLKEDYKLKVDYVTNHFSRMWTRFNFFLSIELALFGVVGFLMFDKEKTEGLIYPALLGIGVSVLFVIVGLQDQKLVDIYRAAVKDVLARLSVAMKSTGDYDEKFTEWVGKVPVGEQDYYIDKEDIKYWKAFRITSLPVITAVISGVLWLGVCYYWWSLK